MVILRVGRDQLLEERLDNGELIDANLGDHPRHFLLKEGLQSLKLAFIELLLGILKLLRRSLHDSLVALDLGPLLLVQVCSPDLEVSQRESSCGSQDLKLERLQVFL